MADQFKHLLRSPTHQAGPPPVLFLFHGMGSNERDLHGLADHMPPEWLVITARGPLQVGPDQFKWFEVKPADDWFDVAPADRKAFVDMDTENAARTQALSFIDAMVQQHGADPAQVVVAGFSQGATLSLNLFLTTPERFLSVGAIGGRVIDEIKPQIAGADALAGKPAFLGFGSQDQFIPAQHATATQAALAALDVQVTVSMDDVGHSFSAKHLEDFIGFLQGLRNS